MKRTSEAFHEMRRAMHKGEVKGAERHATQYQNEALQQAQKELEAERERKRKIAIARSAELAELHNRRAGTGISEEGDVVPIDDLI